MTSDHLQVRISDLLSIADPAVRWIIIKKALAADAMRDNTKPIEAAYRDLDRAELHLRRIAEESSEFLFLPADKEPFDEADKVSGSPQLLDYARRFDKTPKRSRTKPKREEPETNGVHAEDESMAGVPNGSEIVLAEPPREEPTVAADAGEEVDSVVASEDGTEPEVAPDAEGSEATTDDAVDVSVPGQEEQPARVDELRIATRRLRRSPRRRTTGSQDEPVVEAAEVATETQPPVGTAPEADMQAPANETTFSVDLDRVLAVEIRRARWVMLKKLVAHVSRRRHVRSVDAAFLESEATAVAMLREAGGSFTIVRGGEPSDLSDYSRKAVSLEAFATTGDWKGTSLPLSPSMQRQRERDAIRRQEESAKRRNDTPAMVEAPSEAATQPPPETVPPASMETASASGEEDVEQVVVPEAAPAEAVSEGASDDRAAIPYPDMGDIENANDRWLEGLRSRGSDVSVGAEWLARRLETEAARLRMRATHGL